MQVKAKDVLKQLKQAGFKEVRIRGDHHRFDSVNGKHVTVNYSKPGDLIKPGTYNAILRQAGLK